VENVQLIRSDKEDPQTNDEAFAYLRVSVMDPDAKKVGKFSAKIVELGLANIPGLRQPPAYQGRPAIIHWPTLISTKHIQQKVMVEEKVVMVDSVLPDPSSPVPAAKKISIPPMPAGKMIRMPLGRVFATRSGDKGGNANLGYGRRHPRLTPS